MNETKIIGLAGHPLCGKDTVAEYLVSKYGFTHVSTSDTLREYVKENNLGDLSRENLQKVANKLRTEKGADILVRLSLAKHPGKKIVVSGLRAVSEAKVVKVLGGKILTLSAPIAIRYERAKERKRIGDDVSFESFTDIEKRESENPDPHAQNVNAVIKLADVSIQNMGTIEELYKMIDDAIISL